MQGGKDAKGHAHDMPRCGPIARACMHTMRLCGRRKRASTVKEPQPLRCQANVWVLCAVAPLPTHAEGWWGAYLQAVAEAGQRAHCVAAPIGPLLHNAWPAHAHAQAQAAACVPRARAALQHVHIHAPVCKPTWPRRPWPMCRWRGVGDRPHAAVANMHACSSSDCPRHSPLASSNCGGGGALRLNAPDHGTTCMHACVYRLGTLHGTYRWPSGAVVGE